MVTTNPMRMLAAAGIGFEAREYQYDESDLSGVHAAAAKFPSLDAEVVALKNRFFGETVTVSGLLTGGDIADALENRDNKKTVLLPRTSLKEFESVFLDGMTVKELKKRLNRKIRTAGDGYELAKILFDGDFQ